MLTTFALTVAIDLTAAVEVGFLLAVFLFLKRITETSSIESVMSAYERREFNEVAPDEVPAGVEMYQFNGPFFFGTADYLQDALAQVEKPPRVFVLRMRNVPAIDATGINALESFRRYCEKHGTRLLFTAIQEQPRKALDNSGFTGRVGAENMLPDIHEALALARGIVESPSSR